MLVITGAAGFIGSCLAARLLEEGEGPLVLVDDFSRVDKQPNLERIGEGLRIHRNDFFEWFEAHHTRVRFIFHLGARTDTTELDEQLLFGLNEQYTRQMWDACCAYGLPLIYASSAATYGDGGQGFDDDPGKLTELHPLNPYGWSKHRVDLHTRIAKPSPPRWAGLKFFNVYGPNEYHKRKMASVIFHAHRQIKTDGQLRLFRSHRPGVAHGEQMRDFVYVEDVLNVCIWMLRTPFQSGIYNLGSGQASTFNALAHAIFQAMRCPTLIEYIDMPEGLAERYQYYTCAPMQRLRQAGYVKAFTPLTEGVFQYVQHFLERGAYR
ncbi:MAG: ADP-glyceromanno-heptose 6-epimerase [Sphingomonadales bacterium]|nr:ADP-glyceromanno-heptose 6-epimerase [Sphingomonadales bacterium]